MSNRESTNSPSRRAFLRSSIGLGAGATVAVLTTSAATAAIKEDTAVAEKPTGQKGYELTQHVADYYKLAAL